MMDSDLYPSDKDVERMAESTLVILLQVSDDKYKVLRTGNFFFKVDANFCVFCVKLHICHQYLYIPAGYFVRFSMVLFQFYA